MESQDDERNDEAAPLLPSDDSSPPAWLSSPKAIYTLTSLALSFSASSLAFQIACAIALTAGPTDFQISPQIEDCKRGIIAPVCMSCLVL